MIAFFIVYTQALRRGRYRHSTRPHTGHCSVSAAVQSPSVFRSLLSLIFCRRSSLKYNRVSSPGGGAGLSFALTCRAQHTNKRNHAYYYCCVLGHMERMPLTLEPKMSSTSSLAHAGMSFSVKAPKLSSSLYLRAVIGRTVSVGVE